MSSRDGHVFRRWDEAIIPPGRDRERWADRSNYVWWGLAETASDFAGSTPELSLYTSECYKQEDRPTRVRRYAYRLDGFVSLNAPFSGGEMVTHPLRFAGNCLTLNVATSAAGSVRVEIQAADGRPIAGFTSDDCETIYGDDIERVVRWRGSACLDRLCEQPVRLRLILKDADVYSFLFQPTEETLQHRSD
jgi:hypothetical protein